MTTLFVKYEGAFSPLEGLGITVLAFGTFQHVSFTNAQGRQHKLLESVEGIYIETENGKRVATLEEVRAVIDDPKVREGLTYVGA